MEGFVTQALPSSSPSSPPGTIFCLLPEELLERVFSFVPVPHVFVLRLVCKRWNALLRSHSFLVTFDARNRQPETQWIAFFDGLRFADERSLLLYDPCCQKWRCVSLSFLPSKFDIAITAAGGLCCVASSMDTDERSRSDGNVMCVCSPFIKAHKELPPLQLDLVNAYALMEQNEGGSYRVYVMSCGLMAIYDARVGDWLYSSMGGDNVRPRSPVLCHGAMYGLCDKGSLWCESHKLVVSHLNTVVGGNNEGLDEDGHFAGLSNWIEPNQSSWGEISALIRRPRLLGAHGCLLLIAGLKNSPISYSCSTFVVYKFDFTALSWSEIARMPADLYCGFQDHAAVKIFGSIQDVFFFCQNTRMTVACRLSNGQVVWHKVVDCPDLKYCVSSRCKGFTFDLKLGSAIYL